MSHTSKLRLVGVLLALGLLCAVALGFMQVGQSPGVTGGNSSAGLPAGLTFAVPTLTVSTAGSGNGVLGLSGNTSGVATLTAPATAGTNTHPVVSSNAIQLPGTASCTNPDVTFASHTNFGVAGNGTTGVGICTEGVPRFEVSGSSGFSSIFAQNTMGLGWSSSNTFAAGPDTELWRDAPGVVDVGNSTASDTSSKLQAAGFISKGTKFTQDTGCGSIVTSSGGATAGQFTTVGSTSCTTVITFGNTATSAHNWACFAHDLTTSADYNNPHVSSNTTTATIVTGTIVSGDVIEFGCIGY